MSCGCGNRESLQGTLSGQPLRTSRTGSRVTSLTDAELAIGTIVETIGTPLYVEDVSEYTDYGITESGWYAFCRVTAAGGTKVTAATSIEGAAGHIATIGADHVDIAVLFEVAATSKKVVINWGEYTDAFVFKATDLAVRNLDYRVTFYVYDADEFATWHFTRSTDSVFVGTKYYIENNGVYSQAAVKAQDTIPADTYYTHAYALSEDDVFQAGTVYYTLANGVYTAAEVVVGDPLAPEGVDPAPVYYVDQWTLTTDVRFVGTRYYAEHDGVYEQIAVKAGEPCSYYNQVITYPLPENLVHEKVTIEGLVRNVTYRLNDIVDCPMEFILPEIEDETHGCWFEIRCRHDGEYSTTLVPPDGVKIATEHTQKEKAGVNMINLHYTVVDGVKIWRFMNTHSSIPA